jgi:hypothetical protein
MNRILLTTLCLFVFSSTPLSSVEAPKAPQDEFSFVVLGDSQFHKPGAFNQVIDEVALLSPAFVIQVGDLIRGYVQTDDEFRAQWKRFKAQISGLGDVPYYPVPGNHDVFNKERKPEGAAVFREVWGDLYYSFNYRNTHFTVLDTDHEGSQRSISGAQLKWLKSDLQEAQEQTHRIVLFHRPPSNLKNEDELHAVFVKHKVVAAIYGHEHHYHQYVRDGVRYVMTMAATNLGTDFEEAGSFHHYLLATVRDTSFSYAIVKKGGILPPGVVAPQDNKDLFRINRRLLKAKTAVYDSLESSANGKRISISLRNPTQRELHAYLEWELPGLRWEVSPLKGTLATLPPGTEDHAVVFELSYRGTGKPEAYPTCKIQTLYLTHDGDWVTTVKTFSILAKPKASK